MACLLGIEDEALSQADLADYTVNKVGGKPVNNASFLRIHFPVSTVK